MHLPIPGQRVHISTEYHWAKGVPGTVVPHPSPTSPLPNPAPHVRTVPSLHGPLHLLWVVFDEPQIDADGDGPYAEAEIDSRFVVSPPA
jgi:hypothetical protein